MDLPLLKLFKHLSETEIIELSRKGQLEFLTYLSENNFEEHLEVTRQRWLNNQLPTIGKYDVTATDITLTSLVRSKALKSFLLQYPATLEELWKLGGEIDALIHAYTTSSTDSYISLLKEKIEEEAHFSSNIVTASPGITYIYEVATRKVIYVSQKAEDLLGYSKEEITGSEDIFSTLLYPDDKPILFENLEKVIRDEERKTYYSDYRFSDKDGNYHWLRNYVVPYKKEASGIAVQILGFAFEVTQEKETALALEERERQLLEAQAIGKIGSFKWDIIRDDSVSSPELRKIFETTDRQTLAQMMERVHPHDKQRVQKDIADSFKSGFYRSQFRYLGKAGYKVIESTGKVFFTEDGTPSTLIGTIQDITERKRFEENLLQKTLDLEQSNAQLQEFAYVASHDLKEPLRKIGMFSNIILSTDWDNLSGTTKVNFEKINVAAKRMQQLIEGILSYSSLTAKVQKEDYPLQTALEEAIESLEFKIKDSHAVIEYDPLPKAPVVAFQVQQLFLNLLSNALKFARKGVAPHIRVTSRKVVNLDRLQGSGNLLEVSIEDNGIGFSQEASDRIFGLFKRLHAKTDFEGSGVGLAICKKIVENHGGTISAISKEGVGSTFSFTLPLESQG
ncbi:MAG: domain S-box protein [Flaviaesturariibacter sp.]|nr:domain S-box protein [Flaviaesturariibacter sp.]